MPKKPKVPGKVIKIKKKSVKRTEPELVQKEDIKEYYKLLDRALEIEGTHPDTAKSSVKGYAYDAIIDSLADIAEKVESGAELKNLSFSRLQDLLLVASYSYYELDHSLISDASFDRIMRYIGSDFLLRKITITRFQESYGLEVDDSHFKTGSLYDIKYPKVITNVAEKWVG